VRFLENALIATKSPRTHPRSSSQNSGIVESAPSHVHGRAKVEEPLRKLFPTRLGGKTEDGLRTKRVPRMIVTADAPQPSLDRTDLPFIIGQLQELD
jgi:hypothetical protein